MPAFETYHYVRAGGPLLVLIALVCFGTWCYFLRSRARLLEAIREHDGLLRKLADTPPVSDAGNAGETPFAPPEPRVEWILELVKGNRCREETATALDEYERLQIARLESDFFILATLTSAAPLLGLLGTVIGMMATFRAVAGGLLADTPDHVASGISQALITTQFGLAVAIPGFFGLARLRRLLHHVRTRLAACRRRIFMLLDGSKRTPAGAPAITSGDYSTCR